MSTILWQTEIMSVFDLDPERQGTFDIVYSWGVSHQWATCGSVGKAASMVAPNGLFAIALYRKTHMDLFWKLEKRVYAHAPEIVQNVIRAAYIAAVHLRKIATGGSFREYVTNYKSSRGMDFYHDVHDWLGGYPYETTLAPEVETRLASLGFKAERVFARPMSVGIFGSGCDEYVYRSHQMVYGPQKESDGSSWPLSPCDFQPGDRLFDDRQVDQRRRHAEEHRQPPDYVVGTGRLERPAAKPDTKEAADLMAEEGKAEQHG